MKLSLKTTFLFTLIAGTYFVAGLLGQKLAIAPSYTSPIFPSTGIALAALIILGRSYFPAVFIGSAALNIYIRVSHGETFSGSILICSLIGMGATIQALIGHYLTKKAVSKKDHQVYEKNILYFLLSAGPISCLFNATFSVSVLSAFDILGKNDYFYNWLMWFVGDSIGAMVFAPVILTIFEPPKFSMNARKRIAIYPSLFLFSFVVWLFFFNSKQLDDKFRNYIQHESEECAEKIDESMKKYGVILESTEKLFRSSEHVSRKEYRNFIGDFIHKYPGIRAISWNPIVESKSRREFESKAKLEIHGDFRIFDNIDKERSPERERYLPVYYIEPYRENYKALGYDTSFSEIRRKAMSISFSTTDIAITPKIQLIQDTEEVPSIAMYYPVIKNRKHMGFIAGTFKLKDLINSSVNSNNLKGINVLVYDVTDNRKELLYKSIDKEEAHLYETESDLQKNRPSELFVSKTLHLGGRKWVFELFPTASYRSGHSDFTAWTMLFGGLVLVILLQSLMMIMLGRNAIIQKVVDQKTFELSEANAELERIAKVISLDLEESNLNFSRLAESMPDIVWVSDSQGKTLFINSRWEDYTGAKFSSENLFIDIHPEDIEEFQENWHRSLTYGVVFQSKHRIRSEKGIYRWFLARGSAVRDDQDKIIKWFGTTTDIDDQIRDEEERSQLLVREKSAIEASKIKSAFLANMSHEIRTPINGVIGMTCLLKDTPLNDEQKEFAKNIETSANSLLYIINDILDFSKVEAGKLDLEIIDFDFEQTLQETFKTISVLARKKNLPVAISLEDMPDKSLRGDPGRLRQVLTNLLNNAVKFTDSGKVHLRVKMVKASDNKKRFRFEVEDTGIGIAEKSLSKIFQPFDQADSSTTRKFGGTGLGLSISKHLVELMKGQIGFRSDPGYGSVFWFEVEFEQGEKQLSNLRILENGPVSIKKTGIRVLLAEDNQVNQLVAVKQLAKIGCHCDTVANGLEAIEALKNLPYDLVLMDCLMPEMDGYEATRKIRSMNASFSDIPIIAMTANAMKGDREKCIEAGMTDYVSKPISVSALSKVIEYWIQRDDVKLAG